MAVAPLPILVGGIFFRGDKAELNVDSALLLLTQHEGVVTVNQLARVDALRGGMRHAWDNDIVQEAGG